MLKRLKEYIDFKHINISTFEKSIGMSNASFGKSLKNGGAIGTDKLENILKVYPEINPVWLVTGKGKMICDEIEEKKSTENINDSEKDSLNTILIRYEALVVENARLKNRVEELENKG